MFKKSNFFLICTCIVLLSSCNTRKGLDAFFDIPFQKTLNVSKANLQQNSCSELEWNQLTQNNIETFDDESTSVDLSGNEIHFKNELTHAKLSSCLPNEEKTHSLKIPLYLLYLQLKTDLV
ncbi:hypothetical protein [Psychroflexus salis]|uniref:hypothetical protein n=1 Tax=Psychroflexus salis TaxID=1526574 RepID=UPI0016646C2C|nr:hypothetical protein [Psychroflexus salis]